MSSNEHDSDPSTRTGKPRPSGHSTRKLPQQIGHYRILDVLGEGGFGVVYLAEQTEPVRRRVALKVIKPGMDSRAVVARFEAERQALAMMDHPCIASVRRSNRGTNWTRIRLIRRAGACTWPSSHLEGAHV